MTIPTSTVSAVITGATPGTRAPVASVMVPCRVAVDCAKPMFAKTKNIRMAVPISFRNIDDTPFVVNSGRTPVACQELLTRPPIRLGRTSPEERECMLSYAVPESLSSIGPPAVALQPHAASQPRFPLNSLGLFPYSSSPKAPVRSRQSADIIATISTDQNEETRAV